MVSVPAKLTLSGALNQPFAFGAREAAALACGADVVLQSEGRGSRVACLIAAGAADRGGDGVRAAVALRGSHELTPDVASPPLKPTVSGARYQPLAFGGRDGAAVTDGLVASYLKP